MIKVIKRESEKFIETYFNNYEREAEYDAGTLVYIKVHPNGEGRTIFIWNDDYFTETPIDNDEQVELNMQILEEHLINAEEIKSMKEMITYFLDNALTKDYLYCDYGDGEIIYDVIDLDAINNREYYDKDYSDRNLQLMMEVLEDCDVNANWVDVDFISECIQEYGNITFGDKLTIGVVSLKNKEYEELEEV